MHAIYLQNGQVFFSSSNLTLSYSFKGESKRTLRVSQRKHFDLLTIPEKQNETIYITIYIYI